MPQLIFFVICFWIAPLSMRAHFCIPYTFCTWLFLSWKRLAHVCTVSEVKFRQALVCWCSFLSWIICSPGTQVRRPGSYLGVNNSVSGFSPLRTPCDYGLNFLMGTEENVPFQNLFPPFPLSKGRLQSNPLFLSEPHTPLGDFALFLPESPALVGKSLGSCAQNMWQLGQIFATTYSGA